MSQSKLEIKCSRIGCQAGCDSIEFSSGLEISEEEAEEIAKDIMEQEGWLFKEEFGKDVVICPECQWLEKQPVQ